MAGAMGFFDYVSDDGNTYKVKGDATNAAQTGGVTATSTAWYPKGWVLRYLLASASGQPRRRVPVYDPANAIWTGGTTTIPLQVAGTAGTVTFTITGRFGEKRTSRG
jgi:hypothetical protein